MRRWTVGITILGLGIAISGCAHEPAKPESSPPTRPWTLVSGGQGSDRAPTLLIFEMDPASGRLTRKSAYVGIQNPHSIVALTTSPSEILAVSERYGSGSGSLWRFQVSERGLIPSRTWNSGGEGACHVAVDPTSTVALVAHYGDGVVASFDLRGEDPGPRQVFRREGRGPHQKRQTGPHAHGTFVAPGGRTAVFTDLGTDQLGIIHRESDARPWVEGPSIACPPGSGPRHAAWSPNGDALVVLHELDNTLTHFAWDETSRTLTKVATHPTVSPGRTEPAFAGAIRFSPDGQHLAVTSRGANELLLYPRDPATGSFGVPHRAATEAFPWDVVFAPDPRFLLVAESQAGQIAVYEHTESSLLRRSSAPHSGVRTLAFLLVPPESPAKP